MGSSNQDAAGRSGRRRAAATSGAAPPPCRRGGARSAPAVGAGLLVAVLAGGCGGSDARVALPSKTGGRTAPSLSPQDAVKAAYLASAEAYDRASQMRPPQAMTVLKEHNTGSYLDFLAREISTLQERGWELWGTPTRKVTSVSVSGRDGTVVECQDASKAGLADARTHQLIPNSLGSKRQQLAARLRLGDDGKWRVLDIKQYKKPC